MAVFIGGSGTLTTISRTFVNPYTGESLIINGDYYIVNSLITGTSATDDIIVGSSPSQLWYLEDEQNNLLFESLEIFLPAGGDDYVLFASLTHVLGNIIIEGTEGNDVIWSNAGDDLVAGGNGNDTLVGGPGNDLMIGGAGADILNGGTGSDTADYHLSALGVNIDLLNSVYSGGEAQGDTLLSIENIIGSKGVNERDFIYGDNGANKIEGLGGADILEGGGGADIIDGGDGWDYSRYTRSSAGVHINLKTNVNTGGDAEGDLIYNVEAVVGSRYDDVIVGSDNKDYIKGELGDDYLDGGLGGDQLFGGEGNDTYFYSAGRDTIHEQGTGLERVIFDAVWTPFDAVITDNLITFEAGVNEVIFNNMDLIELYSFAGYADMNIAQLLELQGGSYDEVGSIDDDQFFGDDVARSYSGLDGFDSVDYSESLVAVKVDLAAGKGFAGDADGDTYSSIELVWGSDEIGTRDFLWGDDNDNYLGGHRGDDILEGGGGADVLNGGEGWDYARYIRSTEGVHISMLDNSSNTGGDAEGDSLFNIEAIVGSYHGDTLRGGNGNDFLSGVGGDDILTGGLGRDLLIGGTGADTFVFEADSAYDRIDVIRDFNLTEGDVLNITDLLSGFDSLSDDIADFVQFTAHGSDTYVQVNADGAFGGAFLTAFSIEHGVSGTATDLFNSGHLITDETGLL